MAVPVADMVPAAEADPYGSTRQRFQILKVGWQIFESNPVLGVGINGCEIDSRKSHPGDKTLGES